jgi:hypothetical protein
MIDRFPTSTTSTASRCCATVALLTLLLSTAASAQDRPVTSVSQGGGTHVSSSPTLEFVLQSVRDQEGRLPAASETQRLAPGERGSMPDGERRVLRAVLDHGRPGTVHPKTRFKVVSGRDSLAIVWTHDKLGDVQIEGRRPGVAVIAWEILDVPALARQQRSGRMEIVVEKSPHTVAAPGTQQYLGDHLYRLRAALANSHGEPTLREQLAALAREFRCGVREGFAQDGQRIFWVEFPEPLPAAHFAQEMGWGRPYGVAADAQRSAWVLNTSSASNDGSRYLAQLTLAAPQLGEWSVTPRLSGVPRGGSPQVSRDGSPIYDLTQSEGQVVALTIAPAATAPTMDPPPVTPGAQGPPTSAVSTTAIRNAIEASRGAGNPSYLETQFENMRLFIAWNMPYAGRTTTQYWVYCQSGVRWNLVQGYQIEPGAYPVRQARIDTGRRAVEFVLETGAVTERVPIGNCL